MSKLLSLLLDQRPSPKLVLIILQLCRAALPLMSVEDCGNVELPPWSYSVPSLNSEPEDPSDPASKIASLLLAKLADYVVPGEHGQEKACFLGSPQSTLWTVGPVMLVAGVKGAESRVDLWRFQSWYLSRIAV